MAQRNPYAVGYVDPSQLDQNLFQRPTGEKQSTGITWGDEQGTTDIMEPTDYALIAGRQLGLDNNYFYAVYKDGHVEQAFIARTPVEGDTGYENTPEYSSYVGPKTNDTTKTASELAAMGWDMKKAQTDAHGYYLPGKVGDLEFQPYNDPGTSRNSTNLLDSVAPNAIFAVLAGGVGGLAATDVMAFVNGGAVGTEAGGATLAGGGTVDAGASGIGSLGGVEAINNAVPGSIAKGLTDAEIANSVFAPAAGGAAGGIVGTSMAQPATSAAPAAESATATGTTATGTAEGAGGAMDMSGSAAYPSDPSAGTIFDVGNLSTGSYLGDLWAGLPDIAKAALITSGVGLVSGTIQGIGSYVTQNELMEKKIQSEKDLLAQKTEEESKAAENKRRLIQSGDYFSAKLPFSPKKGAVLTRPGGAPVYGSNGLIATRMGG